MNSELFNNIARYASESYEDQLINSPEYAEFTNELIALQEDIKKMNLPDEQKDIVKRLLKEHQDLSLDYVEKIYKQAMIDCVIFLKELKIL
ncbi:MAG: hypothetical protein NC123_20735 [Butyrivibrio sp.]|nr:hypothetical protein [Butyrivibrio sp.]